LPEKVQKIARYNGKSWLLDMYQKADFARAYATSHDEYMALMKELGVTVRVEDRNVAYFYGGQQRAKRGSKMGERYDKEGLERAYKANAEKFARIAGLRESIRGIVGSVADGTNAPDRATDALLKVTDTTYSPAPTDYAAFQRKARPGRPQRFAHEADLGKSVVPIEDMRRARNASILQYCHRNNIALVRHDDGRVTMKGRDFVEIGEFEWVNTRNRTRGSLIELVAAHKQTTLLQAVAEINGNQRLLALEQHFGQVPRKFTSFYIPKESRLREQDAKSKLVSLLASHGADGGHARTLLKTEQVQVDHAGSVRFFPKDDHGGALEFVERSDKSWSSQKSGTFKEPFFTLVSGRKKATVYLDPFSFLQHGGKRAFMARERGEDVICLMEPDHGILDTLLAKHRHLSELHIFTGSQGAAGRAEIDFFNNLKANLATRGIEVKEAKGQARSKSRSHDLPSM
jgi:hypothetical protein